METPATRGYACTDEDSLVGAWRHALPGDPINHATFRRKVLLDPNFDPRFLRVAAGDAGVVGFCLALRRRAPMEGAGLEPERAWITAFGVRPEFQGMGAGRRLLRETLEMLAGEGRREVLIAPYTPNYFVPGVDEALYAPGLRFLLSEGFEVISRPLSMDASIVRFDYAPYRERRRRLAEEGTEVRSLAPSRIPDLLAFLETHTHGDWVRHARELLTDATRGHASFEQVVTAERGGEIVGYCQSEGEHFGPFGVRGDLQGHGIGTVLLATSLEGMRRQGLHNAWVLWASDEAASRVYARFGFRETRRFAVLRRRL